MENFHKKYIVLYEYYDYFAGGSREEHKCYSTAAEVIKAAKKDFLFDDGSYSHHELQEIQWEYEISRQPKHGLVLGYQPTKKVEEPSFEIEEDLFPDLDEGLPF